MPDLSLPFSLSYAALWILVIFQSLVLLGLVRVVHQLQQAGTGSKGSLAGMDAPKFDAVDIWDRPIRSTDFVGHLTALLFVSPSCASCSLTLSEMDALRYKVEGNVIVVCKARRDECARLVERYELTVPTIADDGDRVSQLFGVSSVPTAVLINSDGRIQSYGQPMRAEELEEMMDENRTPQFPG